MPRTEQSLDDEIAEVEGRIAQHRMQLRALSAEARSRVSVRSAVPVALAAALAIGFAASRFTRRPEPPRSYAYEARRPPRIARLDHQPTLSIGVAQRAKPSILTLEALLAAADAALYEAKASNRNCIKLYTPPKAA